MTMSSLMLDPDHQHVFAAGPNCLYCGMHVEETRRQAEHRMLTEAFNRLADVLEKLEKKL